MTPEEIGALNNKYFAEEGYVFPGHFEHRFDFTSSAYMYSMIRKYKPTTAMHIGTWEGGSACIIVAALLKNGKKFKYTASELLDDKREHAQTHVLEQTGYKPKMIGDITKNLRRVPREIDFLFVDTDHDLETTEWIFKKIMPRVKKGSLVIFHDWAVEEMPDGSLNGKGDEGEGGWPETNWMMDEYKNGTLPLKKIFWTFNNPDRQETAFWEKI